MANRELTLRAGEYEAGRTAEVAARGSGPGIGSLRRRLRLRTSSGDMEYFVVWRPKKLAVFINGLLHGAVVRRAAG
jgi:hypothetical protein